MLREREQGVLRPAPRSCCSPIVSPAGVFGAPQSPLRQAGGIEPTRGSARRGGVGGSGACPVPPLSLRAGDAGWGAEVVYPDPGRVRERRRAGRRRSRLRRRRAAGPPGAGGNGRRRSARLLGRGMSFLVTMVGSSPELPGDFAVADGELLDAGECQGESGVRYNQELATAQPLFVHRLRGGGWRILRWLKGNQSPILATERDLLAIGEPLGAKTMRVTILDLARRAVVAQFAAPLGYPELCLEPPAGAVGADGNQERAVVAHRYDFRATNLEVLLPSPAVHRPGEAARLPRDRGRTGAGVAHAPAGARRSRRRTRSSPCATSSMARGGGLIGFNAPARTLQALAFRWPAVALLETTAAPLKQSEVTCESGEYHRPSPPSLRIFDLARGETFVPPPSSPHLAPPAGPCRLVVPPKTD